MKRTAVITLAILGALSVSGCKNEPDPTEYANVSECARDHEYATCKAAFAEAKKQTEASAPKFASADACAAQFANCEKSSSGDWFMPAVMGYMVGNMMSNGSRAPAQPIYIDRSGNHQAASFSGGTYRPTTPPPTYSQRAAARASATTSSRGGFGGRSSSASS